MTPTPSEHAAAVLNLVDSGVIGWDDPEVMRVLRAALKHTVSQPIRKQRSNEPLKPHQIAPSGRMTKAEREQIPRIRFELAQQDITPQIWELEVLARGGAVCFGTNKFKYQLTSDWKT
jgi:large subunit ribosomal protein L30